MIMKNDFKNYFSLLTFIAISLSCFSQKVEFEELEVLIGTDWTGEMIVFNYDENEPETIPARLFIQPNGRKSLSLIYRYPEDSENVSKAPLKLQKGGKRIGRHDIISKTRDKNGNMVIKTQGRGKVEWQKVTYYYTYIVGKNLFKIKRMIWFMEDDIRIIANDFTFTR